MKRGVSRRRGVRGGDWRKEQIGEALGGSGVRGRSVRRSRSSSRGGGWRDEIMPEVYAVL